MLRTPMFEAKCGSPRPLSSAHRGMASLFRSGKSGAVERAAAAEAGCDKYLTKPLEVGRLDDVLAKYAGGARRE
jgi:hypothetical protein